MIVDFDMNVLRARDMSYSFTHIRCWLGGQLLGKLRGKKREGMDEKGRVEKTRGWTKTQRALQIDMGNEVRF
jgi:hypothetical protein